MIVLWVLLTLVAYMAIGFGIVTLLMRSERYGDWEFERWTEMAMVAWPFILLVVAIWEVGAPLARLARRLAGR